MCTYLKIYTYLCKNKIKINMVINNKEEFENFYPYSKDQIKEYPKEYPCVCSWSEEGGGLMGEYKIIYATYFPKNVTTQEAFIQGMTPKWEKLN
jgi:hypothetical protein